MSTLDTHRESKGGGSQEPKAPQACDGDTRIVSTEIPMENTYLDKESSKSTALNYISLYLLLTCKPNLNSLGYYDPFYVRFLRIREWVYNLYIRQLLKGRALINHG